MYGLNINVPSIVLQGLRGMDVCHFDVEQAFVQPKVDKDFSLRPPRGSGRLSGKTARLNKVCSGLSEFPVRGMRILPHAWRNFQQWF